MTKKPNAVNLREAWVLCFILGVIMLNFPFLQIFNRDTTVFGFPTLFLYFFLGWPISILVTYFFSRKLGNDAGNEKINDETRQDHE